MKNATIYFCREPASFQSCNFWCQTINGVFVCTAGCDCAPQVQQRWKYTGVGEGSPLLAQAGPTGLFLVFPSVLCSQPAYGLIQDHCSASPRPGYVPLTWAALCTSDWVSARSLPGKSHTKSLLSMIKCHPKLSPAHEHFPLATLLCIMCGFPLSLWGACSPHLLPSERYGGMGTFCAHNCMPRALPRKSCMHS